MGGLPSSEITQNTPKNFALNRDLLKFLNRYGIQKVFLRRKKTFKVPCFDRSSACITMNLRSSKLSPQILVLVETIKERCLLCLRDGRLSDVTRYLECACYYGESRKNMRCGSTEYVSKFNSKARSSDPTHHSSSI